MKVLIPTPLRQYADKKDAVDVPGATVGEALKNLTTSHPDLKKHLYNEDGKLRAFVNVYLNDEDIRYMEKENTPLRRRTRCRSCCRSPEETGNQAIARFQDWISPWQLLLKQLAPLRRLATTRFSATRAT